MKLLMKTRVLIGGQKKVRKPFPFFVSSAAVGVTLASSAATPVGISDNKYESQPPLPSLA